MLKGIRYSMQAGACIASDKATCYKYPVAVVYVVRKREDTLHGEHLLSFSDITVNETAMQFDRITFVRIMNQA